MQRTARSTAQRSTARTRCRSKPSEKTRPPDPRLTERWCESGALPGSDEVGRAAVRAGRPACGWARAVDGVESAIVEALPRRSEVGADVAAREPDGDRRVPVHPRDAGAVLRRRAGSEAPARAAVEAAG